MLEYAELEWEAERPRSCAFGDIYYARDGVAETQHVFINGNDLIERFSSADRFAIGELGFGAGLNFLSVWRQWRTTAKRDAARLSYFSMEAFPFRQRDLARAHRAFPELAEYSRRLCAYAPIAVPGFHRIDIDHDVTLILYYGMAEHGLRQMSGGVDAWFLDGFAPAKNPQMWSADVISQIAGLSNPGATFATFSAAGAVRRALEGAGFNVQKSAGFGRKKEMLRGKLIRKSPPLPSKTPWFDTQNASKVPPGGAIGVIGGGIAGASAFYALKRAGFRPQIIERANLGAGASGNPAGLIMPRLDLNDTPSAQFHLHAYLYTLRLLTQLKESAGEGLYRQCGVRYMSRDHEQAVRLDKLFAQRILPEDEMQKIDGGLFFPNAGVVSPVNFLNALIGEEHILIGDATRLVARDDGWDVQFKDESSAQFDALVIANGPHALAFSQLRSTPLSVSMGQIDYFPGAPTPQSAYAAGPYAAPAPDGGLVIGATYQGAHLGAAPTATTRATQQNITAVSRLFPTISKNLSKDDAKARAAMRSTSPDSLPLVGPVPDWGFYAGAYDGLRRGARKDFPPGEYLPRLYVLSALGSRGLVTAPLCAAQLSSLMAGAPAPMGRAIGDTLHPARFFIRALKHAA